MATKQERAEELLRQNTSLNKTNKLLQDEFGSGYRKTNLAAMQREVLGKPAPVDREKYTPKKYRKDREKYLLYAITENGRGGKGLDVNFVEEYQNAMGQSKSDLVSILDDKMKMTTFKKKAPSPFATIKFEPIEEEKNTINGLNMEKGTSGYEIGHYIPISQHSNILAVIYAANEVYKIPIESMIEQVDSLIGSYIMGYDKDVTDVKDDRVDWVIEENYF